MTNKLTKEQKRILLKNYLKEDIFVKAIMDTLNEQELNKYIQDNKEVLFKQQKSNSFEGYSQIPIIKLECKI